MALSKFVLVASIKLSIILVVFSIVLGKILNDDQPLSVYQIDEKGFVVVMVTKVKNSL